MKNIAIIGIGNQSLNDHVPAILNRNDLKIVAVCDPLIKAHDTFKNRYPKLAKNVEFYDDINELPFKNIDVAIVCVPHDKYLNISKILCKNNIYFMKEKPFARNLDEAAELQKIKDFNKYCFICTQRRFNPLYTKAQKQLRKIGKPYLFNATYRLNIEDPSEGWRGNAKVAGGGCILDMGYHIIDQLIWWFGTPDHIDTATSALSVERLAGSYSEDSASIMFSYLNGLHGVISLSRSAGEKLEEYNIHGSNGHISGNKKVLSIKNKKGVLIEELNLQNDAVSMDNQLDFFIKRVNKKKDFKDIIDDNMKNMLVIEKCYKIAKSNELSWFKQHLNARLKRSRFSRPLFKSLFN